MDGCIRYCSFSICARVQQEPETGDGLNSLHCVDIVSVCDPRPYMKLQRAQLYAAIVEQCERNAPGRGIRSSAGA
jgi:hypothetical protein